MAKTCPAISSSYPNARGLVQNDEPRADKDLKLQYRSPEFTSRFAAPRQIMVQGEAVVYATVEIERPFSQPLIVMFMSHAPPLRWSSVLAGREGFVAQRDT